MGKSLLVAKKLNTSTFSAAFAMAGTMAVVAYSSISMAQQDRFYQSVDRPIEGVSHHAASVVALIDVNKDGLDDVVMAADDHRANAVFLNAGDGTFHKDSALPNNGGYSSSVSMVDVDNDGDLDIFITNRANQDNFLYYNDGQGRFTLLTEGNIVSDGGDSQGAAWADYNRDGRLDVVVVNGSGQSNFLYQQTGGGGFQRVYNTPISDERLTSSSAVWADYDNDGDDDLFIANSDPRNANSLFRNDGDGYFVKIAQGAIAFDRGQSVSARWVDVDNDQDVDLFVLNQNAAPFLYLNQNGALQKRFQGGLISADISIAGGVQAATWADFDNDADLDVILVFDGASAQFYQNNGFGEFSLLDDAMGDYGYAGKSLAAGHVDQDGRYDLLLANQHGQEMAFFHSLADEQNWLQLKLVGTSSNAMGLGAKVIVEAGDFGQETSQTRHVYSYGDGNGTSASLLHFGLGRHDRVRRLVVQWPSGEESRLGPINANQRYELVEGRGLQTMLATARDASGLEPQIDLQALYDEQGVDAVETHIKENQINDQQWSALLAWLEELILIRSADGETLLIALVDKQQQRAKPSFILAESLRRQGRMLEAIAYYRQALDRLNQDRDISAGEKAYIKSMAGRFAR